MMNLITLKSDGFYIFQKPEDKKEELISVNINETDKPISFYTNYFIEVESNVTIENFMNILMQYEDDIDFLYMGYTKGKPLRPYYEQMQEEVKNESDVDFIEFCWATDYFDFGDDFPADLTLLPDLIGVNKKCLEEESDDSPYYTMAITPLNEWKNAPIHIDKMVEYINYIYMPKENPRFEILMNGNKEWHLHDFIQSFLQEITVHGSPEEKKVYCKELIKKRDEFFERGEELVLVDNGADWEAKSEMFDEKELKRKMKQYVENDEFEKAQEIKDKLDKIKKG